MSHNTIVLKIFKDKSNLDDFSVYICSMTEKIIDIKNKILKDIFNSSEFNYLDFENISEKVYKDYGKLFFDKGILPRTIDNYSLQNFTIENRDFSFLCIPTNICGVFRKLHQPSVSPVAPHPEQALLGANEKLKLIRNNYSDSRKNPNKTLQKNENKFIFNEDDFPPLK